ncbi:MULTISPECIES: putative CRISPR-associated protein [Acidianus]|uniref:CRISPR system ring nuclease SSO1393-like domain-containing protein n=1 Tax=Candidatus Acidianus copahuensis TaxID=1160895 RepID=A0A031LJX3_9CREN|nr:MULTISPECIES: putative CRISPR-associated protein [Acidianus]EZQ01534.1 hypothetical protein CM19_13025 [Candidatus Acidianus copahuensis]NON61274.1 putative CRISPR-associated protein [Acidianus sp. RZ1]
MEKGTTILSLVGTSLLGNFERDNADYLNSRNLRGISTLDLKDPKQQLVLTYKGELFDKLSDFVTKNPKRYSAELNTIISYLEEEKPKDVKVFLYRTDSNNVELVTEVIKDYIVKKLGCYVDVIEVRFKEDFYSGVLDLVQKVYKRVAEEKKNNRVVVMAATAGFKPETAYATIAAMLAGADKAIYMHESMRSLVELPLIAVEISPAVLKELESLPARYSPDKHDKLLDSGVAKLGDDRVVKPTEFGRKLYESLK